LKETFDIKNNIYKLAKILRLIYWLCCL